MKKQLFVLCVFLWNVCNSQLLPTIGLTHRPPDNALICKPPFYLGGFYTSGYAAGNSVADFKLYDLNGDSLILSNELVQGKPVLLISGSLTCPVFRNKINTINQVAATYSNAVKVFVIYTLEAHPTDTSVYFGKVNVTTQNANSGILFPQPVTYVQRKHLVDTMDHWLNINVPVFIDGPCNEWWNAFGPAPNNAYIIGTNGKVLKKHGWFDKSPDKIFCDLDSILTITSNSCIVNTAPGNFKINVLNSSVNGNPGELLYDFVQIINTESVSVVVSAKKLQKDLPLDWETAFCADICYATNEDSISFVVPPKDTLLFSLDFYTGPAQDSGGVKVGLRNVNKPGNSFLLRLRANTFQSTVGVQEHSMYSEKLFYPNPAKQKITISDKGQDLFVRIYDNAGRELYAQPNSGEILTDEFSPGIYLVTLSGENSFRSARLIVSD